jgi:hypothetical protein
MGQKYAATCPQTGIVIFYDDVDSPVPPGVKAIPITDDEHIAACSRVGFSITSEGKLKEPEAEPVQVLMARNAAKAVSMATAKGLLVTSKSTTILNGTYSIDELAQNKIHRVVTYLSQYNKFPGNPGDTLLWTDMKGLPHTFPSVEVFQSFAVAVQDYVANITSVANNSPGTDLPPATVTIV